METTPTPYDTDIEQALLGAVMVDNYWLEQLSTKLKPDHFYDPLHGRLFAAMLDAWQHGGAVTPLTLKVAFEGDKGLQEIGGYAYLESLAKAASALPNVKDYSKILLDLATRRELILVSDVIRENALDKSLELTPAEQISEAEKILYQVAETNHYGTDADSFDTVVDQALKRAETAYNHGGHITGIPTGLADLDNLLGGLHQSDLLILAGRPGMGKTALATKIAYHAAAANRQVLFFSLEMAGNQLASRMLADQIDVDVRKMRSGRFTPEEWERLVLASNILRKLPLRIDDTGALAIAQIAARARRQKRKKRLDLVVVDYLQLVQPSRKRHENRTQEVTEITGGLKALAKELDVPILALSQLSRGVDGREDKRPVLSDLRESGSIEQDADVVMFVYREEFYIKHREPEDTTTKEHSKWQTRMDRAKNHADLLVEKHRNGPTGKVELFFDERFTRFGNLMKKPPGV